MYSPLLPCKSIWATEMAIQRYYAAQIIDERSAVDQHLSMANLMMPQLRSVPYHVPETRQYMKRYSFQLSISQVLQLETEKQIFMQFEI